MGVIQRLLRHVLLDSDTEEERTVKQVMVPTLFFCSIGCALVLLFNVGGLWGFRGKQFAFGVGVISLSLEVVVTFLYSLAARRFPRSLAEFFCVVATFSLFIVDWSQAAGATPRLWPQVVLVMDCLLAINGSRKVQRLVMASTTIWLSVNTVEWSARLGMWDVPYWVDSRREDVIRDYVCADPPCAVPWTGSGVQLTIALLTLFVDFVATRGFAEGLRRENARVMSMVRTTEQLAVLLAAYSVTEAERVVEADGEQLPEELRDALELLLANLKSYRPYLPDSLLCSASESTDGDLEVNVAPPGVDSADQSADVCICFTDIEASTALWEGYPQGMYDALQIHNRVMRQTAAACGGYEVKTIGDSFMLCFSGPVSACRFALLVQQRLLQQPWPQDLLRDELCATRVAPAPAGHCATGTLTGSLRVVWNGLRVRIGINWGEARVQRNPVTGRCDYFGGTVNVAARVESALGRGGLNGVTGAVLAALGDEGLRELGNPTVTLFGSRQLKGVKEAVDIRVILPAELALRTAADAAAVLVVEKPDGRRSTHRLSSSIEHQSPLRESTGSTIRSVSTFGRTQSNTVTTHQHHRADIAQGALALQLRGSVATCCTLRVPLGHMESVELIGLHLTALTQAADVSHGVLSGVLSCCAVVSWNATMPCPDHGSAFAHFATAVQRDHRTLRRHFGAASGEVLSGNVAGGRRRYATIVGGCVELSAELAEEAEVCQDAALAIGVVADVFAAQGCAFRAQLWHEVPGPSATVWELVLLADAERSRDANGPCSAWLQLLEAGQEAEATKRWCEQLPGVFRSVAGLPAAEQLAELRKLAAEAPADAHCARLLLRAERGVLRTRQVPSTLSAHSGLQGMRHSPSLFFEQPRSPSGLPDSEF